MALRPATKIKSREAEIETPRDPAHQRKKPEERYWLQVDRQTKGSYTTLATAEAAGEVIKKAHPIVQVSVYDSVDCVNKIIGAAPALGGAAPPLPRRRRRRAQAAHPGPQLELPPPQARRRPAAAHRPLSPLCCRAASPDNRAREA